MAFVQTCGGRARAMWRGESDIHGQWQFQQPHEMDRDVVASLDLEAVHRDLFPQWIVAAARADRYPTWEQETYTDLRSAVRSDANLTWMLDELRNIILRGDVVTEAERLRYLTWLWSSYLDRAGQPYWVQGGVGIRPGRVSFFYLVAYHTEADLTVDVDAQSRRVRLVSRMDQMNLRELHLGSVSRHEDGAVIIADRVQDFAVNAVWPVLGRREGAASPTRDVLIDRFSESVTDEAREGLPAEQFEVLARTAEHRAILIETSEAISQRRWCSGFALNTTPIEGFSDERLMRFGWLSIRSEGSWCPRIKLEEAEALVKYSEAIRADSILNGGEGQPEEASGEEPLGVAVETLVAWLSRTVAVHEGRHLADEAAGGASSLECESCGPPAVASEVSAYLASFAWGPAPSTALYQACRAVRRRTNPLAAAMEAIQQRLGHLCQEGPHEDLVSQARALEAEMLGHRHPIRLPESFPSRLVLTRASSSRVRATERTAAR